MGILRTDTISGLETPTPVTGSVSFDGTGDYLQTPDSEIFSLEKNDYTIEGWFYFTTLSATQRLFGQRAADASELQMLLETNSSGELTYYFSISSTKNVGGVVATKVNTWHHIAVVRKDLVHTLYVDGVSVATNSTDTGSLDNRAQPFSIGRQGNYTSDAFNGHISNFRICKGTAVYTSNFTVPTHALEVTQDTVLLCCNNSDSVTASDHGTVGAAPPTLTANGDTAVSSINPGLTRDFTGGTQFQGVAKFDTQGYFVPPSGTTTERFPDFGAVDAASARGVFGGGRTPTYLNTIDYVTISTTGNAQDFGDLTHARGYIASSSSRTRGVFNGGGVPGAVNTQDFITISSTGDAQNFGELQTARYGAGNCSSSTRGAFGGGNPGPSNVIEFITIATTGNTQDFGDLTQARVYIAGCSSSTRGVFGGGTTPSDKVDTMDFIAISSTGNATDFGNLTQARTGVSGLSSRTRGVFGGGLSGNDPYTYHNIIDYITIAALGNATDFGDLTTGAYYAAGCSSSILGVFGGLSTSSGVFTNIIEYVTIASTGNAQDFGDLTSTRGVAAAVSNGHGGLG